MRFSENKTDNSSLFIDECKPSNHHHHSSLQYQPSRPEQISYSSEKTPSPSSEYIYTEIVKAIGNNEFVKEKRFLKRVSWSPLGQHECGLPPTGKRIDALDGTVTRNSNRIRMRPHALKNSPPEQISLVRPVSFNEKYDRIFIDRLANQSSNQNESLTKRQRELSPTPSLSSIDTILHITKRDSPSFDNSDFISDTSSVSSLTTTNTTTSLPSAIYSKRKSSNNDGIYSTTTTTTRPLRNDHQQRDLNHIDHKFLSPILKTNTVALASPISSSQSSTSSSSSSSISFTCPKGHKESSPSPIGSSLNQHAKFTTQTPTIDSSREDIARPTTTTRSMMTMSISPNRHHNQTYSMNPINTSIRPMTNNNDELKQQRDQTESTMISNSCLKSQKSNTNNNRTKKFVHFDRHLPTEMRPPLPSTHNDYRLPFTVTSSSMCNRNSLADHDEQKRKNHGETSEEKERNEMTRRTIIASAPLTTHTVHRSFSLSPSPPSKKENSDSRRPRQGKRENVDELNCTTSRQVTTAATHLYCTPNTATVTLNDGNYHTSLTKEPNGTTNNFNTSANLTHSTAENQMPSDNRLGKILSSNPPTPTTKKFIGTGGFFSFINRSNSSNNKSSSVDDNKQLRRTSSTQRKSKQYLTHDNKRLSADVESLHSSSISLSNAWKGDTDKVIRNGQKDRPSTIDNNANSNTSYNTDPSILSYPNTNMNRSSISMLTKPTTTTIKSNEGDSLNNGLLFQPVPLVKKDAFFLAPSKAFSNTNDSSSSMGKIMQTSTLIISTPPQYHYYLYPPTSGSKKNSTTNRTISNVSMNSISTNSSSSSSYESHMHDLDDDTSSYSAYQTKTTQSRPSSRAKPLILSDSVQAFWPPQLSMKLNNEPEQLKMVSPIEQNKHSNLIKHKQSESNTMKNTMLSSTYNDESLSISNGNQTDGLPPSTSLMLNNKEEVCSYSEQNLLNNTSLRIASVPSCEDTQASYSERLREKSRSITTTANRSLTMDVNNSSLFRSRSKDTLNHQTENCNSINRNFSRPKSAGQSRVHAVLSPIGHEISNDFQSKRQFFENRIYTDHASIATSNKIYALPPTSNTNQQRHVAKQPPPPLPPPSSDSMIRTTKYFDSSSNPSSLPPTVYRKPFRIVKAVQRSIPSSPVNEMKPSLSTTIHPTNDLPLLSFTNLSETRTNTDHHLSSEYVRNLFPTPDHLKRTRSRQNSSTHTNSNIETTSNNAAVQQTEDLLLNLTKRLEIFKENQRVINDEIEINTKLGAKLINIIECKGELNEIEKFKLHINEIETITSVLLKLSTRLAKVENDLLMITDDKDQTKASLLERREKIQQKHDEAKSLKDGIDRRSRLVTTILQKYLSTEQFDDYDHFIRMKSTLLIDAKDMEETIVLIQQQIQLLRHTSSSTVNNSSYTSTSSVSLLESGVPKAENISTNYSNAISTTA